MSILYSLHTTKSPAVISFDYKLRQCKEYHDARGAVAMEALSAGPIAVRVRLQ